MEDMNVVDNCTKMCQPSCEENTYAYEIDTTNLETVRLCEEGQPTRDVTEGPGWGIVKHVNLLYLLLDGVSPLECNRK